MNEISVIHDVSKDFVNKHPNACFLTITLKPKLYKYSSVTQLELTNNEIYDILYKCADDFNIIAEHTKQGNVHYHAMVNFRTKTDVVLCMNKFKSNKKIGFIKMDSEINNPKACAEYLVKDVIDSSKIFRSVRGHQPYYHMTADLYRALYDN